MTNGLEKAKKLTFDLERSYDWPGTANRRADRNLYNVIDWRGEFRGQVALTADEALELTPLTPLGLQSLDTGGGAA